MIAGKLIVIIPWNWNMLIVFRQSIVDFLDNHEFHKVFVYFAERESLVASLSAPTRIPAGRKLIFFVKSHPTDITIENITKEVVSGDISASTALDHLLTVAKEIYLPLIARQESLPADVRKEALTSMQQFIGGVYVLAGQTQGRTLLSTPQLNEGVDEAERAIALETAVVQWTKQIKVSSIMSVIF